jgi:hypothetical protein
METHREECICAVSGRLVNVARTWLLAAERSYCGREDEIRAMDGNDNLEKDFGLRSFIPSSTIDRDQYERNVAEKCFALSKQMGRLTFFLTITMKPDWRDYRALKRGSTDFADVRMVSLVFQSGPKLLMKYCQTTRSFGDLKAFMWRVEYWQRALPHAHIPFWTDADISDIQEMYKLVNARYPESSSI